ncbi:MAG: class I SAM-dependent methyltransferase [Deltaproteobacteria bacterium]|nr:class I SAM-dependent methyltransferase [Deltaproteobacteria bacterium]
MEDLSTHAEQWQAAYARVQSPLYKRLAYVVLRPLLARHARTFLGAEMLAAPGLSRVLFERGFPLEDRRAWLNRHAQLGGKHLLLQGTGTGWDVLTWLWLQPARITAVDLFSFAESWREIRAHCARVPGSGTQVSFLLGALEGIPLPDASVDVAASDAVFEHCRDLSAVLRESHRVLRPGGFLYASYGPLWNTFGGDHFSGRGGLTHGFAHLEADPADYRAYFEKHVTDDEDAQNGGRYVELDLFSKLTTREYLRLYAEAGFEVVDLILQVSAEAVAFRRQWPERFDAIWRKHPGLTADDLLVKTHLLILRKKARQGTP